MGFLIKGSLGSHGLTKCQFFSTNSFVKPPPKGIALSLFTICFGLETSSLILMFSIFFVKFLVFFKVIFFSFICFILFLRSSFISLLNSLVKTKKLRLSSRFLDFLADSI